MTRQARKPSTIFAIGGFVASAILVAFGVVSIFVGYQGREDVRESLRQENIVGTPDSTIPGQVVDTGSEARAFADVMREHTLARTDGLTYSELPRYLDENGQGTNDAEAAALNAEGRPVENPLRQLWVTETALSTALNTAYFAEQVGLFSIVMGVALVLTGFGFAVLSAGALLHVSIFQSERETVPARAVTAS